MSDLHQKPVRHVADPAARTAKKGFNILSASSLGIEMGLSVLLGILGGLWIDSKLNTTPLFMLVFLVFGMIAGFRGVMRALRRAERARNEEARNDG